MSARVDFGKLSQKQRERATDRAIAYFTRDSWFVVQVTALGPPLKPLSGWHRFECAVANVRRRLDAIERLRTGEWDDATMPWESDY